MFVGQGARADLQRGPRHPQRPDRSSELVGNRFRRSDQHRAVFDLVDELFPVGTRPAAFGTDANGKSLQTQEEYVQYGTYTPFSVTVTHLLYNKSGINFSSYSHTGLPAAVYASGVGENLFVGGYDNTDIYNKMAQLLGIG